MEPITYLVGLSGLIGGYIWFLVHNRQVSYRSAMNFTISRRQSKLYDEKGFDLRKWEDLMQEGNKLRTEIKLIAEEYDVTWNEKEQDAATEKAIEALDEEKKKKKEEKGEDSDEEKKGES
jgi:calcium uniporter protein, mitochondrial